MLFYRQFGNHSMILTKKRIICFHCTCRAIMNDCVPFEANAACQVQLMTPKIPLKILLFRRRGGQKEVRRLNSKPLRRHPSNNCRNSAQNIDRPSNSTPSTSFSSSRADTASRASAMRTRFAAIVPASTFSQWTKVINPLIPGLVIRPAWISGPS